MRNIVLLTFDSVRADHCGYMGYDRDTTPNMDELASDGVAYENAVASASRTNPSISGIMTGKPIYYRGKISNPTHARSHLHRHGTLAEDLSDMGYATAAFCPNAYSSRYYGFDRGFDMFEDFLFTSDRYQSLWDRHIEESGWFTTLRNLRNFVKREEAFRTWDTYVDDAVEWVDNQKEPFFLWMFSLDTHYPYLTPRSSRRYSSLFNQYYYNWKCYQLIDEFDTNISNRLKEKIVDIYDDSIRFGDRLIGELQDRLDDFDPVFVVHSDHGEAFGERGMYGHSFPYLYDENIHIPLTISGLDEQRTVSDPASLLQLRESAPKLSQGQLPDLTDEYALSTEYDGRNDRSITAVRSTDYKYIVTRTGENSTRELYELNADQTEQNNILDNGADQVDNLANAGNRYVNHKEEVHRIRHAVQRLNGV